MMKFFLLTCCLFAALLTSPAQATDWNALLDRGMPQDLKFGAALAGNVPFERNPNEQMAIASTAKLFTAGAILARLGADYRYSTLLRWKQSGSGQAYDITIHGSGDPSWGMKEFGEELRGRLDAFAQALFDQGVREVDSSIRLEGNDPRLNRVNFPVGWKDEDSADCGGAIAQAFNLSANCANYKVSGPGKGAWGVPGLNVPVEVKIAAGSETKLTARMVRPKPDSYGFVITGTWARGAAPREVSLPIHDTRPWIRALLLQAMRDRGIRVQAKGAKFPVGAQRELRFQSPAMNVLVQPFLKNSVNFLGDVFLKTLGIAGHRSAQADLRDAGLAVLREHLVSAGFSKGYSLYDGSGLSRISMASPRMLLAYLTFLRAQPYFPAVWDALAIAGADGTLKARYKGTAAEGVLRGKTGTLDGVYNLAGYVPHGRDFIPFVLFSKTAPERGKLIRVALDRVGLQLTQLHFDRTAWLEPVSFSENGLAEIPFVQEHSGEKLE